MLFKGRELCYHADPKRVYELVSWSGVCYTIKNDDGDVLQVQHNEFTPLSMAGEELVRAEPDGRLVYVQELIDGDAVFKCSPSHVDEPTASSPPRPSKAQGRAKGEASEARAKVRELLSEAKTREEIAAVAQPILLESVEYLVGKYAHLDNGRFKMVISNRMVGVVVKC